MAVGLAAVGGVAFGWWLVAAVAIPAVGIAADRRERQAWAAAILIVAVAALGAWRAAASTSTLPTALADLSVEAAVVSAPVNSGSRQHFIAEVPLRGTAASEAARVCVTAGPLPAVRMGDLIEMHATADAAADVPVGIRSMLAVRGCGARAYATSIAVVGASPSLARWLADARASIGAILRRAAPGDAGVLLSGLVTGDDEGFSPRRESAFRQTNTTHLTAVSGSNLALVAGMMATLGAATIGRHRLFWQTLTIAAVWTYAAVSGAQPPAMRAAVVATAAVLAFRFGRRADFPTLILLAAGVMVLLEPRQIDMLGFRLSVAASLALAFVFNAMSIHERSPIVVDIVTATAAAQLATLPLLLPIFGTVSLVSLPANVLVAPLATLAMPIAAVAGIAGLVWAPLGAAIAAPAGLLAAVILWTVDLLAAGPGQIVVGMPPATATLAIAVAVIAILSALSGATLRFAPVCRAMLQTASGRAQPGSRFSDDAPCAPRRSPAAALAVVAREDPLDPLRADPNDPEEEPPGQEDRHELADVRQRGEPVL
jgi:competence protein ComEC